ncbi:MAG: putative 2OG-Fe(II) oxygenase [Sphingomonas sp.]
METPSPLPPALLVGLLREAAAIPGGAPDVLIRLARALHGIGDTPGAIVELNRFVAIQGDNVDAFRLLASLHLEIDDHEAALHASQRGGASATVLQARALMGLDRNDEAEHLLRRILEEAVNPLAFERLSRLLARQGRGGELIALCEARGGQPGCATIGLAFRALALSLVGRDEEAVRIVDPQRHVKQVRFAPPDDAGKGDRFNTELAAQILRQPRPSVRDGLSIAYEPDLTRVPHLGALHLFLQREMERYVAELPERGLDGVMPLPPLRARLHSGSTVLIGEGRHGEHFHPRGYVSCVYHVSVPQALSSAEDPRGALMIGSCDSLGGHSLPWQMRQIRPEAGVLTIFPAHFFHDVVPTGLVEPRISVAGDMEPVA